ncbi:MULTISPECIES: ATP-binding protein [Rhizobium]|uniref:histidine kinase n=1 Tax=Rhizobium tropici TaxID=398 RepID=A0A329YA97_RHITR|nr:MULTISPECIES: ATP-binding protein [Rhizobium]MBB3290453.1 signal transduction histidine kinase [Rhizobium sp. BK252]MBB3405229.1 signal transduction histidine kinase [Rhizobium sp. BK289]MBB3417780.1 signal transduction histidine kinase [Rhizobium sp. BK284]MBB3485659.1 signal transduction histidine kinase [Rhizobium sp. BK347]RAX40377.1 two-component sensor histidine kinase [Rhizobium tropici]
MIKKWTRSLAAQFIGFTLAALLIAQAITFVISWNEHSKALDAAAKSEFFSRTRTITRLVNDAVPSSRQQVLTASETGDSRFWMSAQDPMSASAWRLEAVEQFSRPLENYVDLVRFFEGGTAVPRIPSAKKVASSNNSEDWKAPFQELWALRQPVKYLYFDGARGYGMVVKLDDGTHLNAAFYMKQGSWWTSTSLSSLVLTAAVLALIGVLVGNRIARPLKSLAIAAEALGRGENLPPLEETGPEEVRRTASAFNRMQARLHRFIDDRTKMLAAIGHDLRTPLTSLRLRTEFVKDEEIQRKMLATIEELQGMTEAAIAFARGESTEEETRPIQLEALIGSICDDQEDLGYPVTLVSADKITYRCRPDGLRRAVRNIVENAVRYGGEAKVLILQTAGTVDIVVEDRGPGIPEDMREKVFAPFFRLEVSRNKQTGGIGLGLSIARAVARQHGGDIMFVTKENGMRTIISLPRHDDSETGRTANAKRWNVGAAIIASRRRRQVRPISLHTK